MLRKEAVVPEMINLIKELQSNSLFDDHILAGGTALTLQIGHRTSTDIDLFASKKQSVSMFTDYFKKNYKDIDIHIVDENFIRIFVNKIKVEMVYDEEKRIETPRIEDNIKMFNVNEIAVMKIKAITGRTQARDFIDIAFLLKEMTLHKMFELYKEKYGMISPLYMKRMLLTKSRTIKDDEWLVDIKMLRDDIIPKDVPKIIESEILKYNRNLGIGAQE